MNSTKETWLAVVNLHAGSGKTVSVWRTAEKILGELNVNYDNKYTDCKYHATEISYNAAVSGCRKFIAVGGDGTIHEVMEGIMRFVDEAGIFGRDAKLSDFYVAVIPIGSGNDWIKTHNISHNIREIVQLIKDNSFVGQDIVKVGVLQMPQSAAHQPFNESEVKSVLSVVPLKYSWMVNIGGVGFDARICERVNVQKSMGKRGKLLYVNSLIYNLMRHKSSPMSIWCDGERIYEGDCYTIALGIGTYSGGGMRQTPYAVYDDGLLDYMVVPAYLVPKLVLDAPKLFTDKFLTSKGLIFGRGKVITVVPLDDNPEIVEVDGEILGKVPVRFEVLSDQINVLHRSI